MEADNILWVILWIALMLVGWAVETKKKKQAAEEQRKQAQSAQKAMMETWAESPVEPSRNPMIPKIPKPEKLAPQSMAVSLPEKGQRVTKKRIQPTPSAALQASGLHNKENLKRAIIFGEILAPKF